TGSATGQKKGGFFLCEWWTHSESADLHSARVTEDSRASESRLTCASSSPSHRTATPFCARGIRLQGISTHLLLWALSTSGQHHVCARPLSTTLKEMATLLVKGFLCSHKKLQLTSSTHKNSVQQ